MSDERWLTTIWPFVREHLPPAPGRVLEVGCGPAGGFVPALLSAGYDAVGIDPAAPGGPDYRQVPFEEHPVDVPADAIVACISLHHAADPDGVLDRMAAALAPGGVVIVVEWAHERFDERTATWCFDRLAGTGEPNWLHRRRDRWKESGLPWDDHRAARAHQGSLYDGRRIVAGLHGRFRTRLSEEGPYFFADLDGVTAADEQAAIDSGRIQATGLRYVGTRLDFAAPPGSAPGDG
ncbi:class I SAM-dependent methyltransferase [Actinomadura craniellae]|uniref:class I SAM-dependent methyltransferase n=1 Tax=Actinomadura craniellae TaxID=2231787 RepID=UPI0013146F04|nr:class I SAM-dependent methyltransferase [Actinomadura craniellae]